MVRGQKKFGWFAWTMWTIKILIKWMSCLWDWKGVLKNSLDMVFCKKIEINKFHQRIQGIFVSITV